MNKFKNERNQHIKPEVSLLLPVYNEAETIESVITEFHNEICSKIPLEIIVAEDGSTDGTKRVLLDLARKIPVKLVLGKQRKGYSKGLIDGLSKIETEFVAVVDSDGQHLANDFWKLYDLRYKYDVVGGWRVKRADGFYRKFMSGVFQQMAKLLFDLPKFHDVTGPYKLMRTNVAKEIAEDFKYMQESFWTEFTIRAFNKGFSMAEVPVAHRSRLHGSTNVYRVNRLLRIILSQFSGMLKLKRELSTDNNKNRNSKS